MVLFLAEMEGFEPPHALRRLADFESAPFSHLGTSPCMIIGALYQLPSEKSRIFRLFRFLFCQFHYLVQCFGDCFVVLPAVGPQAVGAILDALFGVLEIAAAVFPQGVQGAITENAAETFRVGAGMAGEIFAFPVLKKVVMAHNFYPLQFNPVPLFGDTVLNDFAFRQTAVLLDRPGRGNEAILSLPQTIRTRSSPKEPLNKSSSACGGSFVMPISTLQPRQTVV